MDKDSIRRRVRARKSLLSDAEREISASRVFAQLESLAAFAMSDKILVYNSLPDELSTRSFIDKWKSSKKFFLPRVNGLDLEILPYEGTSMRYGAFHIEEPEGDDITDVAEIELIVVPGVAYDSRGNRIGRGKGYYDRLLGRSKALTVGVCYDFQLVDAIETEPHDVAVDLVITESGVFSRRKH